MAVDLTLQTITSGYNTSKINSNFAAIDVALQDALSRSGHSPNTMTADLDLNSNDLLNAGSGAFTALTIGGVDVHNLTGTQGPPGTAGSIWYEGNADPSNALGIVNDYYLQLTNGATGIIGDVWLKGVSVWAKVGNIRGAQGTNGAGTGDMLKANNLSDVVSATTSLTNIGGAPLASPTLTGVPAAPTAAADTTTTQLATTAFVIGQASATTPAANGTAAIGTSKKYARADHVHASDTTKANLASPALTGVPTAPTATVGTNTTQLATTAFVLANTSAAAGGITLLATITPSGTSFTSGTLSTAYKSLYIIINGLTLAGSGFPAESLLVNVSNDAGSTWDSDKAIISFGNATFPIYAVINLYASGLNTMQKFLDYKVVVGGTSGNSFAVFTTKTGLVNAVRFSSLKGNTYTGGSVLFYGVN